jgi:hypothetical protein
MEKDPFDNHQGHKINRRVFLGSSASSVLFLPGCFFIAALARILIGRGLVTGLARGAVSRGALMTSTVGRANAVASRAFSSARAPIKTAPRRPANPKTKPQKDDGSTSNELIRAIRVVKRLEKISVRDEKDPETEISSITEIDEETVKCSVYAKNSEVVCWKKNEDLLVHYDICGAAAGSTRVENEFEHLHFADRKESLIIGRDKFVDGKVLHYRGGEELIGSSDILQDVDATKLLASQDLVKAIENYPFEHTEKELQSCYEAIERRQRAAENPGSVPLTDFLK